MAKMSLKILLFSIVLVVFSKHAQGEKPQMYPDVRELVITEGEKLEIKCVSSHQNFFIYPNVDRENTLNPTDTDDPYFSFKTDGTVESYLTKNTTNAADSGWYACYDALATEPTEPDYNNPNATLMYVYVKSKNHLFVQNSTELVFGRVGGPVIIPCRPSSPELNVEIYKVIKHFLSPKDIHKKIKKTYGYDPRSGFTIPNLSDDDEGPYECWVQQGDRYETVTHYVSILQSDTETDLK